MERRENEVRAVENWPQLISTLGFPAVVALMLGWAIWKTFIWVGKELAKPVIERFIGHLDTVDGELKKLSSAWLDVARELALLRISLARVCPHTTDPTKFEVSEAISVRPMQGGKG